MSLVESSTNMDSLDGPSHPSSSENSFSKNSDRELGFSENISQSLGQAPQNHRISAECNENSWSISGADLNTDSTVTPPGSSIVNASHGGLTSNPYGYHRPTQTLLDPMIVNASHGGASSYHYTCHPATLTPLDSRLLNALHGGLVSRPYACQQPPPSYVTLHNNSLNFNNRDFYTAQSDEKDPSSEKKKEPISCKCKCKSTKCLKLYCDCFGQGSFCDEDCMCQQCLNRPEYEDEEVVEARKVVLDRDPHAFSPKDNRKGWACRKSQCKQKYCACFLTGVACSSACRCEDCQNPTGNKDDAMHVLGGKCDMNEPTIAEKLANLEFIDDNKENSLSTQQPSTIANPPSADSVHILLKQALHADDRALLLDCLYTRDEKVIAKSTSLLNPADVLKLLGSLTSMIESRGAVLVCALPWLRSLLCQHASSIVSQESSLLILNSLYQIIESRISTLGSAVQLSTCVDYLFVGIPDSEAEEESTVPALIYEDKDSEEELG